MSTVRHLTALALLAALVLIPNVALAQTGLSDSLSETVIDLSTGGAVPLVAPPPVFVAISDTTPGEPPLTVPMPGREINFLEPIGTANLISDRLSIFPYEMLVQSDDEGNLARRTNATLIPASAFESFQPIRIEARSDGDITGTGQVSDTLTVTVGYYGPGTGTVVFTGTIPEPLPEGTTEPVLTAVVPPTFFDIEEPPIETGGALGKISDYADILSTIQIRFISSDDQAIYANLPVVNGSIFESVQLGGGVVYAVDFRSDAVPEPASFALLGVALLAAVSFASRRQRK